MDPWQYVDSYKLRSMVYIRVSVHRYKSLLAEG